MAEEAKQKPERNAAETTGAKEDGAKKDGAKRRSLLGRILTRKGITTILVVSVVIHGIGFASYRLKGSSTPALPTPEVSLGAFRFEANKDEGGRVASAEFSLYIALLEQVEQAARGRLAAHQFRVQQDVEELLRQAHSGDFDDSALSELKRQLQEQINETLGMRAIADVIITDLKLTFSEKEEVSEIDAEAEVPWVEEDSP